MIETAVSAIRKALMTTSSGGLLYALTAALSYLECAAFVGLLMPGESFVTFAGFLASRGILRFDVLLPLVMISAFLGDITGYAVGFKLGPAFLETTHRFLRIPRPLMDSARDFFRRHGEKTVLIARFVGFLRALAPFLAGASRARFGRFLLFDAIGAAAWATAFLSLGYFLGEGAKAVEKIIGRGGLILALAAAVVWAAVVLIRRYGVAMAGLRYIVRKEVIFSAWFLTGAVLLWATLENMSSAAAAAFDRRFLLAVHSWASPALDHAMLLLTQAGSLPVTAVFVLLAGITLYGRRRRLEAVLYAGAVTTGILVGSLVKAIVQRPRPELWAPLLVMPATSFPSGHTVAASMNFWFLAWLLAREARSTGRLALGSAVAMVPLLVGFSRIYLGVHWPTDILGGYAVSFAVMAPWLYLYEVVRRK